MEGYLHSRDRTKIYHQSWQQKDAVGILVISHGHAEYGGRYESVALRFAKENFSVYALDYRGHGKSEGKRGHVNDFEEYVDDLGALIRLVEEEKKNKPVFLLGHSMGGLIAASYCLKFPAKLNGLILSSPVLELKIKANFLERAFAAAMSIIKPDFVLPRTLNPDDLARDKKVVKEYLSDPLIHKKITARLYTEMCKRANEVMQRAGEFDLPVLLLIGDEDKIVSLEAAKEFYERIPQKAKKLKLYKGGYHELLNDFDRQVVINDILSWLRGNLLTISGA